MSLETRRQQVLVLTPLLDPQRDAVTEDQVNLVVTAGAGSGKTRTLVTRYLYLLASHPDPTRIAAITFTEKATREMRNRVRTGLLELSQKTKIDEDRAHWQALEQLIDSARIGTIHSLCAEVLRAHPAEAGVDPQFTVIEEGAGLALKAQSATAAAAWAVEQVPFQSLFHTLTAQGLEDLIHWMLNHRLEVENAAGVDPDQAITAYLTAQLAAHPIAGNLALLLDMQADGSLADDATTIAPQIVDFITAWQAAQTQFVEEGWLPAAQSWFTIRKNLMDMRKGRRASEAKAAFRDLRDFLEENILKVTGKDTPPDLEMEEQFAASTRLIHQAYQFALDAYTTAKQTRHALDFDDLEAGAQQLLAQPTVQAQWQTNIQALLVDEYQDTNRRQQQIIEAIIGDHSNRLFVVGDARQSIYRFRGADVTVFTETLDSVEKAGGRAIHLNTTFRSHRPLLDCLDSLLSPIMGTEPDSSRPYHIPYTSLTAFHQDPDENITQPYIEFIVGGHENTPSARPVAAEALAACLLDYHNTGEIKSWNEVVLLFRATSGFTHYERAFDKANIPFVTVAGRGFYSRPEIRDILNILRALSDPADDAALAGMLRSPALGFSDTDLFRLRFGPKGRRQIFTALQNAPDALPPERSHLIDRALKIFEVFAPKTNQLPIAELLKKLIDALDYRAILTIGPGRLVRNLDKLLEDAQASRLVQVSAFLEYINTLRDIGAREGEAPADAGDSVRLMTIHKAKGLEFPIVVLADAGHRGAGQYARAYIHPQTGLAPSLNRMETKSVLYNLAKQLEALENDSETQRLLYVAATRAQQKLLISGHASQGRSGEWRFSGWLKELAETAQISPQAIFDTPGSWYETPLSPRGRAKALAHTPESLPNARAPDPESKTPEAGAQTKLYKPYAIPSEEHQDTDEPDPEDIWQRDWRATGDHPYAPASVVGTLVHRALQRWCFPKHPAFDTLIDSAAIQEGLANPAQRQAARHQTTQLLERFQAHPLYTQIDQSPQRFHELPFAVPASSFAKTGLIDLLFQAPNGWQIIDFKTDTIKDEEGLHEKTEEYRQQLETYLNGCQPFLSGPLTAHICFLDYKNQIHLVKIP